MSGLSPTRADRRQARSPRPPVRPRCLPLDDTLIVDELDRLERSLRDATDIAEELTRRDARLDLGGSVYDRTDPVGRLLFDVLGMVAEFETDRIRGRTRAGMADAKARGTIKGRKRKLSPPRNATSSTSTAPATTP